MRKERTSHENISKGKNIKKAVIKRINDSVLNKNIRTIETQKNRKMHLNLNNDSNPYYNRTIKFKRLPSQNNYNDDFIYNEKLNNIFLEKNNHLFYSNRTRNKIVHIYQNKENNLKSRKKALIELNFKNIFPSNPNSKKNKNKQKKEFMNMSHQSREEECNRKFYLNGNYNKIYHKCFNKRNNFLNNNNNTYCSPKNIINDNSNNKFLDNSNNDFLTTKDRSNFNNKYINNNYSNFENDLIKDNDTPIITNFSCRNNIYSCKKANLTLSNQQKKKKKYIIESYENKMNNNDITNMQKYKDDKFLEKKKEAFKIYKKHYASKSQENIKENNNKYNKKDITILKKKNYYDYYKNKIKFIYKIQKWWKYMLFHMYIERKIFFIQRFYRNYLKSRKDSIKINLEYIYNINKILLIQKMWKKINKKRLNQNLENNNNSILKKSIPFKLDNFDINDNTDSNIEIKTEENKNENIYNKKNKFKYISKKLQIKQEINFFLLSKKREELLAIELQRKTNMFITKEYKIKKPNINKKKIILNYNNITKVRLNKNKIINKIILIQKIIKEYINSKNRKYIQKPNTKIYFFEKLRKLKNLWDYSSHNKIESLSFKGNYFIDNSNSNKDK